MLLGHQEEYQRSGFIIKCKLKNISIMRKRGSNELSFWFFMEGSDNLFLANDTKYILFFNSCVRYIRKQCKQPFDFRCFGARKSGDIFFLLIFVVKKQASEMRCPYIIGMAIMLIFYYGLWILYFTGNANSIIFLGMAVLPVVYFILAEIWLQNYLAIIPTVLFGIVHVINTYLSIAN